MLPFKFLFPACLLIVLPVFGWAQTPALDPDTTRICATVKDTPFPVQDRPAADETSALAGCVSQDLYYGFSKAPYYEKARKCAYLEMDAGNNKAFSGRSILMMIYANGLSVPRNLDLSIRLACEIGGGDAAGTVHELQRYKAGNWQGTNFSICDHSSAPYLYQQCALLDDRFDRVKRHEKLDAIAAPWTPRQKRAYQSFLKAAIAFFEARANAEINLESTFAVQEVAFHERELIATLEKFEKGELPKFTESDLKKAEEEMQTKFRETQEKNPHQWGTVSSENIRRTQPSWLAYREAWIALGKARWPGVTPTSWKTWTAEERVVMLERSLH